MALLSIKEKILNNFENKHFTIGMFLDFRKAFDSIKHDILFYKLPFYGIRGVALDLVRSYLSCRLQYTSLNGYRSKLEQISYGVPQGSILGPLFFIIYINDIVRIPKTPEIVLYADDTSLFFSGPCLRDLEISANTWLSELSSWLDSNQLQLNVTKTKYIIFKPRSKPDDCEIILKFQEAPIERVTIYKFLGILFEENLSWTPHVNKIHASISRSIGILYKIRTLVPGWLRRQLYYSLVHSHLHYCLLVWGSTTKTNIDRLFVLQKRAVRCIENLQRTDHTAPFFLKHSFLNISQLFQLKLSIYIFNEFNRDQSTFFDAFLPRNIQYNLRYDSYRIPWSRTNYGHTKLAYLIPDFLNKHPAVREMLHECGSKHTFKRNIKRYLLSCPIE